MSVRCKIIFGLVALFCYLVAANAEAHDPRSLTVRVEQYSGTVFLMDVQYPPVLESAEHPNVTLSSCLAMTPESAQQHLSQLAFECEGGISENMLEINYPQGNPSLSTLVLVKWLSGEETAKILTPDVVQWRIPRDQVQSTVFVDYIRHGISHIWTGWDHLLFVIGLLGLCRSWRQILTTITGFTLAHSITLTLATFQLVSLPIAPTEAVIALSVLFLARELAVGNKQSVARQYPFLISALFGLLHGFGFAGALGETGMPGHAFVSALLGFNIGVEIGQLIFIGAALAIFVLLRLLFVSFFKPGFTQTKWVRNMPVYTFGAVSAYWFIERMSPVLWS